MRLDVDTGSAVPPYEQIRSQIAQLAATGDLAVGTRLPTIRQLAGDLGLAPGTVARAYRELESEGVVASRVRHGTTIAARRRPSAARSQQELRAAARVLAQTARTLGFSPDEAARALAAEFTTAG